MTLSEPGLVFVGGDSVVITGPDAFLFTGTAALAVHLS